MVMCQKQLIFIIYTPPPDLGQVMHSQDLGSLTVAKRGYIIYTYSDEKGSERLIT